MKNKGNAKIDTTTRNTFLPNIAKLSKAIHQAEKARTARVWTAPLLRKKIQEYERLQQRIDAAFGGQPFLPNEPPTSWRNRKRCRTYFEMMNALTEIKIALIQELMRVHGVDPNNPHQMWEPPAIAAENGATAVPISEPRRRRPYGSDVLGERHDPKSATKTTSGVKKACEGPRVHQTSRTRNP